jgi:1-acyl-sn-glycerol-3-phosphate acyltransferase
MLVAGSNVPVVPCYLSGARAALPKGAWIPRPRPIRLTIGKPRTYASASHDKESSRHVCQDLREAVVQLGGAKTKSTGSAAGR